MWSIGESLGATVQRMLTEEALISHSELGEYAGVGASVVETVAQATPARMVAVRRVLGRVRDWVRSRYGLREIILPEKYLVDAGHDVVVTYSSCLALIYFAANKEQLTRETIVGDSHRRALYEGIVAHPGIGLVLTRAEDGVHAASEDGEALIKNAAATVLSGANPLQRYATEPHELRAIESLVLQPNCGDIVVFGEYDGNEIVSFDDQVGAHGSSGGDQVYPFLITPEGLLHPAEVIEDARDIHRVVMLKYASSGGQAKSS